MSQTPSFSLEADAQVFCVEPPTEGSIKSVVVLDEDKGLPLLEDAPISSDVAFGESQAADTV